MIGLRTGLATGLRTGLALGIGADEIANGAVSVPWTVDGTSGIAVPANATEWTAFIAAKGLSISVPDSLWTMQQASGDAADAIGSVPLTAAGTGISYQQAVSGWSRKAVLFTDAGSGQLKNTPNSPDISTTSQTTLIIAKVNSSAAATRNILAQGTTSRAVMNLLSTSVIRVAIGSNTADGATNPVGSVKPMLLQTVTGSSVTGLTDAERLSPTFTAGSGMTTCIGANNNTSPAMAVLYGLQWTGAHAEMSVANLKALLQAMGFVITWS